MSDPVDPKSTFTTRHRIHRPDEFDAVYEEGAVAKLGPLRVHSMPNDRPISRLGLSVSARVGSAVVRNRVKRMLRESFRLNQHQSPRGFDWVVVVSPHKAKRLTDYRQLLAEAMRRSCRQWSQWRETGR